MLEEKIAKSAETKKGKLEKQYSPKAKGDKKNTSNPQTPKQKKSINAEKFTPKSKTINQSASTADFSNSSGKPKSRYKGKGVDANGRPRNFYNPPGKVIRQLAQQSYYDNFYGHQGQIHTLKQKYKTQLCKHFLDQGNCPLQQYCQFAHGPDDLRQPNDPLPKNFGKTALGAVHSNYKTIPCKYWEDNGECKFGDSCSFFHANDEKRKLIDPLPNLPEGVTLPPMPEKYHNHRHNKGRHFNNSAGYNHRYFNSAGPPGFTISSYNEQIGFGQQTSMIQITSISDIAAIGGFNPDKYLSPMPPPPVYLDGMPLLSTPDISSFQCIPNETGDKIDQKVSNYPGKMEYVPKEKIEAPQTLELADK